jgi:hypothetical protein
MSLPFIGRRAKAKQVCSTSALPSYTRISWFSAPSYRVDGRSLAIAIRQDLQPSNWLIAKYNIYSYNIGYGTKLPNYIDVNIVLYE